MFSLMSDLNVISFGFPNWIRFKVGPGLNLLHLTQLVYFLVFQFKYLEEVP